MAAMAEHVRKHKVVLLEELSSLFSMRTKDVIACLKQLEADGAISGVIDDRGKFICMHNTRPLAQTGWLTNSQTFGPMNSTRWRASSRSAGGYRSRSWRPRATA